MNKGVIILALNKQSYACAAFNLALSIKYYNPDLNITLLTDNTHQKCFKVEHYSVFDNIKEIPKEDYTDVYGFSPAKAKLNVYKYTPYDQTLYVDADSICLQSLDGLFNRLIGRWFKSDVVEDYTTWTDAETFEAFFGVKQGVTINSSWFYFENNEVLELASQYYEKGFPKDKLNQKWGNALPDELFLNAAVTKLEVDCKLNSKVSFFDDRKDQRSTSQLSEDYYFITYYGNKNNTRLHLQEWYDKMMFKICSQKGIEHRFKMHEIITHKHVNNK